MAIVTLPSNLDDGEDVRTIEVHRKTEKENLKKRYWNIMDKIKQLMYFSIPLLLDMAVEQSLRIMIN